MTQEAQPSKEAMEAAKSIMTALGISQQLYRGDARRLAAIIDASHAGLREELARFKALDQNLPEGFAIGDDATADLAIELVEAKFKMTGLREELERAKHSGD